MRYAFAFDASSCTGCKACQVACKDKNGLPNGVLWRRVYEVSGGEWQPRGAAWTNTVFAYNVSMGCNHCEDPACVAACPTGAYAVRDDGIVWQEAEKCIGCQYCAWACPYGAPQYSAERGRTGKCDLCMDLIDRGLPPACVAACPMRALDYIMVGGADAAETARGAGAPSMQRLWTTAATDRPFPLSAHVLAKPYVAMKPHPAMANDLPKVVANDEEVRPLPSPRDERQWAHRRLSEWPLVAFTLLGQAAAGIALVTFGLGVLSSPLRIVMGLLLATAVLGSLLHLGAISPAWRAPANAKMSRLSREVLVVALMGLAWLLTFAAPRAGHAAVAICGAGLVFSMAEVYRLDAVPPWNSWRTQASFAATTLLLGLVVVAALTGSPSGAAPVRWAWPLAWMVLGFEGWLAAAGSDARLGRSLGWRLALIVAAMVAIATLPLAPVASRPGIVTLTVAAVLVQEVLGRAEFYSGIRQKAM